MTGTAGPAGYSRLGRLAVAVGVLIPLVTVGSPSVPGTATTAAATVSDAVPTASHTTDASDTTRIAFAGTRHRSLGRVTGGSSEPLFGPGPAHFDQQPSARGGQVVFTSMRDSVRPQVYLRDAAGAVSKLTTGRDAAHPRLSPDGKSVVFDSAEPALLGSGTQRDLWVVGTDGSGLRRLTDTATDEVSPTFSPDGTRIAYSCEASPLTGKQIYERALSGGPITRVSAGPAGDATEPVWNPVNDDAHRDLVAYTLDAGGDTGPRLRVTERRRLRRAPPGRRPGRLAHEVRRLAAGRRRTALHQPRHGLRMHDQLRQRLPLGGPFGRHREPDTPGGPRCRLPHLARTPGLRLRVVARTSAPGIHVVTLQDVRPDGSDPRDLGVTILNEDPEADTNTDASTDPLFNPKAAYDPWTERQNYTPDGRRIVVTRFEGDDGRRIERIWQVDADGSHLEPMRLDGRGADDWDTDPTFSPDGKLLAFTRTSPGGVGGASGPGRILVANVATGEIVDRITPPAGQSSGSDAQPTWSSDGKTIAFTRTLVIAGAGGNKHIWTVPVDALDRQTDLSATACPDDCQVIDDSPAFSPDGLSLAFNRKDGGGRINERDGMLLMSLTGGGCQVVLPASLRNNANACGQALPDTTATGPFQPRDVAWSADASRLVLSSRREVAANSPESLATVDLASGELTPLDSGLPGRQKEPSFQQSVNLAVSAPPTAPPIPIGSSAPLTVTVTNHGPSASPGTTLTVAAPPGVRLDGLTTPAGPAPKAPRSATWECSRPAGASR